MALANINGVDLFFDQIGAGEPLLFHHGYTGSHDSWAGIVDRLEDRYQCTVMDCRGAADSAHPEDGYTVAQMANDVIGMADHLGLQSFTYIGHSMGGMNAMTFAGRHPDQVRALILIDVGPEVSVDGAKEVQQFVAGPYEMDSLDEWVEHTHKYYPYRSKERIRARLAVSLRETPEGKMAKQYDQRFREQGFGGVARAKDDIWDVAKAVACPTLLLHGEKSPVLKREQAEKFAAANSHVELVTIPEAGHSVAGDQPDAFVAEARRFLNSALT